MTRTIQISFFRLGMRSYSMEATLEETGDQLTLRVPVEGDDDYVIVGTRDGSIFTGRHEGGPDDNVVRVAWAKLGTTTVGYWDEEGEPRHFFSFDDSAITNRATPDL
jgi:hypothetical protein